MNKRRGKPEAGYTHEAEQAKLDGVEVSTLQQSSDCLCSALLFILGPKAEFLGFRESPTISMNACGRCAGDKFDHHPRKKF